jgi:hypothetical protein
MKALHLITKSAALCLALALVSAPSAQANDEWALDLSKGDGKVEFFAEG